MRSSQFAYGSAASAGPGVLAGGVRSERMPGMSPLPLSDELIHAPEDLSQSTFCPKTPQELVHTHVAARIRWDAPLALMQASANCRATLCHATSRYTGR